MKITDKFKYSYTLGGVYLKRTQRLGILVPLDLSPRSHISKIIREPNHTIGMIKLCSTNLTQKEKLNQNPFSTRIQPLRK